MSFQANLSAALAALESAPSSVVSTVVGETSSIFNGMSSQVNTSLTAIMVNYTDAGVVGDEVKKIKEIANVPPAVSALVSAIPVAAAAAAANSAQLPALVSIVSGIKAML